MFIQDLFSLAGESLYVAMLVLSSKNLHSSMLRSILHSKMQFFESTPIGRIINRFSKDLTSIEFIIPFSFKEFSFCTFDVLTIFVMISISTPYFLIALIPIAVIYFFLQVGN